MRDIRVSQHRRGEKPGARRALASSHRPRRAFSLTEVLLAVFILAIGIISIASLFPAGIAQQRLSTDDAMGSVVANHALSVIRSKVRQEDFGTFEDYAFFFGSGAPQAYFTRTTVGDWGWIRPAFLLSDNEDTPIDERGAIDIFSHYFVRQQVQGEITPPQFLPESLVTEMPFGWPQADKWSAIGWAGNDQPLWGIPFSREASPVDWWDRRENFDGVPTPPRRIITQHERFYPMQTDLIHPVLAEDPDFRLERPQPEYVWDCMFRRYNGRIQVAIFVYRVSSADARDARWRVPQNDWDLWGDRVTQDIELFPPLPVRLDFVNPDNPATILNDDYYPEGPWDVWYSPNEPHHPVTFVPGLNTGGADSTQEQFNLDDPHQSWQQRRQWLLDQNSNVHRVVGHQIDRNDDEFPVRVELSRPLQPIRVTPNWRNTVDPGFQEFQSPFQNWPLNSQIAAEYYADIPDDQPAANVSSYADVATFNPGTDPSPSFFNWETSFDRGVVTRIWYIPRLVVDEFGNEWRLTPVYVAVKEL